MAKLIDKLETAPDALADVGAKLNEVITVLQAFQQMTGTKPIKVDVADGNVRVSIDTSQLGGAGLPDGYMFEEFTICDSGEPAVRWWPTWLTNPEA